MTTSRWARELRWEHLLIELLLIVGGILAALAVDGWIDDRRDARSERQYLELVLRDLGADLATLDEVRRFEEAQVKASVFAYRALRDGVAPDQRDRVAEALVQLTSRRTLRLGRAAYTDLLSTGNLRLIRNAVLRDRIVRLYESNERAQLIRDRNNQEWVDRMYMTYLVDHDYVAPRPVRNLVTLTPSNQTYARRMAITVDTTDDMLWQLPPGAPEWRILAGRVWYRGLISEGAIETTHQMENEIGAVRKAIDSELAQRRWP